MKSWGTKPWIPAAEANSDQDIGPDLPTISRTWRPPASKRSSQLNAVPSGAAGLAQVDGPHPGLQVALHAKLADDEPGDDGDQ